MQFKRPSYAMICILPTSSSHVLDIFGIVGCRNEALLFVADQFGSQSSAKFEQLLLTHCCQLTGDCFHAVDRLKRVRLATADRFLLSVL